MVDHDVVRDGVGDARAEESRRIRAVDGALDVIGHGLDLGEAFAGGLVGCDGGDVLGHPVTRLGVGVEQWGVDAVLLGYVAQPRREGVARGCVERGGLRVVAHGLLVAAVPALPIPQACPAEDGVLEEAQESWQACEKLGKFVGVHAAQEDL